jgi:hypothetical protein
MKIRGHLMNDADIITKYKEHQINSSTHDQGSGTLKGTQRSHNMKIEKEQTFS